jgi:hypothetical protein
MSLVFSWFQLIKFVSICATNKWDEPDRRIYLHLSANSAPTCEPHFLFIRFSRFPLPKLAKTRPWLLCLCASLIPLPPSLAILQRFGWL